MVNDEMPVKTICVMAEPGTIAIEKGEDGHEYLGSRVIAWAIGIRQSSIGDIWPDHLFTTPVTFSNNKDIVGVVHPDGSVDYGDGEHYMSFDMCMKAQAVQIASSSAGKDET
jgi:hypothetical protein